MAGQKPKSARTIAIEVLNHFNPERNYASPILNKLLGETDQKQRATDLVLGTIRNSRAIDTVIATFSGRPLERIPGKLLNIIRIGTYELIYSPATGQHSIVNEAVENTKDIAPEKQVGFVNAVLRQITRHITNRQIHGCEFDKDFLPDPEALPVDYLSTVFSLPRWLVSDWLGELGAELTRQICLASNRRPSIYIRPNSLKTTTQQLAQKLKKDGVEANITPDESMIKLKSPQAVTQLPGFAEGLFTIQDIAASQPIRILKPQPGWTILDLCAAPGVKTTQLAEATGDSATIIATDIDAERLKKVKENTTRLGINSVNIVSYEEILNSKFQIPNSKFDCVLLDVPCSNTGVLARRIEVRYRIKPKAIKKLTKTQSKLLATAAPMVKSATAPAAFKRTRTATL